MADEMTQRIADVLAREFGSFLAHDPHDPERFYRGAAEQVRAVLGEAMREANLQAFIEEAAMTTPTSTQLTHMLTADIRAAIRVQMLPPAALAEALVAAGWRPTETTETTDDVTREAS